MKLVNKKNIDETKSWVMKSLKKIGKSSTRLRNKEDSEK